MAGHTDLLRPTFKATLAADVANKDGRVNYMRAILTEQDGQYIAKTTGTARFWYPSLPCIGRMD